MSDEQSGFEGESDEERLEREEREEAEYAMAREAEAAAYKRRVLLSARQTQALAACVQALDALGHETSIDDEPYVNEARDRVLHAARANFFAPPEPMFGPSFWETVVEALSQQLPNIVAMSASARTAGAASVAAAAPATHFTATADGRVTPPQAPEDGSYANPSIKTYFEQFAGSFADADLIYLHKLLMTEMRERTGRAK